MLNTTRRINAKANLNALRQSYHIVASRTDAARAQKLAATVRAIRPGVYTVGACTADLWRMSCTCKTARSRKARGITQDRQPCAHFLALYLSGDWLPLFSPVEYFQSAGIEEPEILEIHCRATLPACYPPAPKGFRLLEACDEYATLENLATGTHATVHPSKLCNLRPIYAEAPTVITEAHR